jgi:hypothetical protein
LRLLAGGSGAGVAGSVEFADYNPGWQEPTINGNRVIGWSNSLGVTAPDGVGLFCRKPLKAARRLRRLRSEEAIDLMRSGRLPLSVRLRALFP